MQNDSALLLKARRAERETLLRRLTELLEADPRVGAAWLFGSLARGDADDLSDIDLWVVVSDEHIAEVVAARREYVSQLGEPLLIEEAPQNAPVSGAYLLVLYPGEAGPQQVDWYWQPRSDARVPQKVRVLFNRAGVQTETPNEPYSERERTEAATAQVVFFWAMCNITAKKIARRQPWAAIEMLSMIGQVLDEVRWMVGKASAQPSHGYEGTQPPPVQPGEQLVLLRAMAREMSALMPLVAAPGMPMPSGGAIAQIDRFFGLVESIIKEDVWPQL
jgi:predicted nucleotidyltransferase